MLGLLVLAERHPQRDDEPGEHDPLLPQLNSRRMCSRLFAGADDVALSIHERLQVLAGVRHTDCLAQQAPLVLVELEAGPRSRPARTASA